MKAAVSLRCCSGSIILVFSRRRQRMQSSRSAWVSQRDRTCLRSKLQNKHKHKHIKGKHEAVSKEAVFWAPLHLSIIHRPSDGGILPPSSPHLGYPFSTAHRPSIPNYHFLLHCHASGSESMAPSSTLAYGRGAIEYLLTT